MLNVPFHVMQQRTELLKAGDNEKLKELEKQCLAQNAKFTNWECDEEKMKLTKNGEALYMHCLPADISGVSCKQGIRYDAPARYKLSGVRHQSAQAEARRRHHGEEVLRYRGKDQEKDRPGCGEAERGGPVSESGVQYGDLRRAPCR